MRDRVGSAPLAEIRQRENGKVKDQPAGLSGCEKLSDFLSEPLLAARVGVFAEGSISMRRRSKEFGYASGSDFMNASNSASAIGTRCFSSG